MSGVLYLVSTPIGNLADLTIRARTTLETADVCYAEDTRRTGRLLAHLDLKVTLRSLHAHNEAARTGEIIERVQAGQACAVVSDAGTPAISDPGRRVVNAVLNAGLRVVPIPGPSAVTAALVASGFEADRFSFLGFPPRSGRDRARWLALATGSGLTWVAFESPKRLHRLLADLVNEGLGVRRGAVCRELTKLHEEVRRDTIAGLAGVYQDQEVRGEVTVVVEGGPVPGGPVVDPRGRATELADAGCGAREIATRLQEELGLSRNEAYDLGLWALSGTERPS